MMYFLHAAIYESLISFPFASSEDYQGPTSTGLFKWMPDENGQMRPVTRMKEKNLERNPGFWDKVYDKKNVDN